jgi:hypothetical protein
MDQAPAAQHHESAGTCEPAPAPARTPNRTPRPPAAAPPRSAFPRRRPATGPAGTTASPARQPAVPPAYTQRCHLDDGPAISPAGLSDKLDLDLAIWACFANARTDAEQASQDQHEQDLAA